MALKEYKKSGNNEPERQTDSSFSVKLLCSGRKINRIKVQ